MDDRNEIHVRLEDEWAQLIRRMGAQLSVPPESVIALALGHLDQLLNLTIEAPVVIERHRDGEITVEKILSQSEPEPQGGRCTWGDLVRHPRFEELEIRYPFTRWLPARRINLPHGSTVEWRLRS